MSGMILPTNRHSVTNPFMKTIYCNNLSPLATTSNHLLIRDMHFLFVEYLHSTKTKFTSLDMHNWYHNLKNMKISENRINET